MQLCKSFKLKIKTKKPKQSKSCFGFYLYKSKVFDCSSATKDCNPVPETENGD